MTDWFVVAVEPFEADFRVDVFGPFNHDIDARAYAMDLHDDNGWLYVEAHDITIEHASRLATEKITYPYKEE